MTRAWTLEGLAACYALAAAGSSLTEIAEALGRFKAEVDHALWVLVGRTPEQALAMLGGGPAAEVGAEVAPEVPPAKRTPLGRFLRELFE